jgi:hypothetical protein
MLDDVRLHVKRLKRKRIVRQNRNEFDNKRLKRGTSFERSWRGKRQKGDRSWLKL